MIQTKTRIKKAVILAGGQGTNLSPLSSYSPTWMLPVLNKPLIEYTIELLRHNGFEKLIVSVSDEKILSDSFEKSNFPDINIIYHGEDKPRGTAGALKDLKKYLDEPFLVINSNIFVGKLSLNKFIKSHFDTGAKVTVGIYRDRDNSSNWSGENIAITKDRMVEKFHIIHSSMDRRSPWRFSGIYLFDPLVFRFINDKNYMDIKEQLIPSLQEKGLPISAYEIEDFHLSINNINDYMNTHRSLLVKGCYTESENKIEIAPDIWVGKNIEISPTAYLLGPILIGDGCNIKDRAQVIGPTVIGNNCLISEGVLVRESILWNGTSLLNRSRIEYSILGSHSIIPDEYCIKNMLVLNGTKLKDANLIPKNYNIQGILSTAINRQKVGKIAKRIMDVALSATGIILLLPLFLLVAIAIKIDSPGPVFYIQKRCGRGGKFFGMVKFRTMIANAEKLHKELIGENETDGPMFKLSNDPRVTRLGRIMRKTSIDELPQLLNVLKGEMSLVGPRPLIMDEMKFSPSWRDTRLKVKPGITGLWQIQGRSEASFHDWIRYDTYYVKNQSFWLDIKILFKTIKVILQKVGAY